MRRCTDPTEAGDRYYRRVVPPIGDGQRVSKSDVRSAVATVQGKPVVRRGRKARDLPRKTARLPEPSKVVDHEVVPVKAILARFTVALSLLATIALTLGAGVKWH